MKPLRGIREVVWLALVLAAATASAQAQTSAGVLKLANGSVSAVREGQTLPLTPGANLLVGDRLNTGANSSALVQLRDNSNVSLGASSSLEIKAFAFEPTTENGNLALTLLRGTLRMVSGLIAKASPDKVELRTPTALIGVRGTDFIVDVQDNTP